MRTILHIDFNSYFATVEQQANPRLRGKPIGVTGGDRLKRTVVGAASIEAKKFGVKTGMAIWQAKQLCPEIILVQGDSDKYLETTKRFLNIIKDYSPYVEVFSIDECFLEVEGNPIKIATEIKRRIKEEVGDYITCSIGISYNKLMAKLAGSLYKPDGLVMIADEEAAQFILDRIDLDEICGIGFRTKKRLNNIGVNNFKDLRKVPLKALQACFKSYGQTLYNMSLGIDNSPVIPFYEKEEVKSIGHRHTIDHDTKDETEIKQILLKLTELIARKLRAKKLVGKTVSFWLRNSDFSGEGMQATITSTQDGLDIFNTAWKIFHQIWPARNALARNASPIDASGSHSEAGGIGNKIRMIGVSISNLRPRNPETLSLLPETNRQETIIKAIDKINNKFGEFTLQRGILLNSSNIKRKANSFLADRRFKI